MGDQVFRPLEPGVVAFGAGGEQALRDYYGKLDGATLTESKRFKGVFEGRVGGELTFYVPEAVAASFKGIAEAGTVAGVRDRALRESAADPEAKEGLDNLNSMFGALKGDEVLVSAGATNLAGFLRALADPDVVGYRDPSYYRELAKRPAAIEFSQTYGAKVLRNIALRYGWNAALTKEVLPRATAKIDSTPEAQRAAVIEALGTETNLKKLDALIGKESPPPPRKPVRPTKSNLGVDRGVRAWSLFEATEARGAVRRGEVNVDPAKIKQRADVLQILDRAKQGVFKDLSHKSRVELVDRFDELAVLSGMGRGRANALRGSLAEVLLRPDPKEIKVAFLDHNRVTLQTTGATIPDYSLTHAGHKEWVNQKSDWIDKKDLLTKAGETRRGIAAAILYRDKARLEAANVPVGDLYSLDFIRDPGDPTRSSMLRIIFQEAGVHRVKFGETWYDRSSVR